jgi:carbamoyl-phosphate synthase small subunit
VIEKNSAPAILALADGTIFKGISVGASGSRIGEVVFNTSMTGYQEILTDPSYSRQIITFTYPHIGNVGINTEDSESDLVHASGMVIRDLSMISSSFRSDMPLGEYLKQKDIVAISEVDTRKLTRLLRDKGAQNGCLMAGDVNEKEAVKLAQDFSGLKGIDLASVVTTQAEHNWSEGSWQLGQGFRKPDQSKFKVVALDFGVKQNILRLLADRGCDVQVVPATASAAEVMDHNPDGVFLSNGPGDPEPCDYAIEVIRNLLENSLPIFGICLGHQLLGLAAGGATQKMKFGHHGGNHPVIELDTGRVMITSQNHGFAVSEENMPEAIVPTHRSLFDGTLQGIKIKDKPAFSFQGHPEASPGPHDMLPLFDLFIRNMSEASANTSGNNA